MNDDPLISIITPVYNGEQYVSGCIESVVAAGCTEAEHIIVDGASTDRTVVIVREKARMHGHVRWISEPDRGQSDALNKGINLARAAYIGILNVDDFYEPGALSQIVEIIRSLREARFIVGVCNVLTIDDKLLYVNRPYDPTFEKIMVDEDLWPYPHNPASYFYPKVLHQFTGLYNTEEHQAMDLEFLLAALQVTKPLFVDAVLGNWRNIPGTKTFKNIENRSIYALKRKIRAEAWRRAPLRTKMRIASLWVSHRPYRLKVAYWNLRRAHG